MFGQPALAQNVHVEFGLASEAAIGEPHRWNQQSHRLHSFGQAKRIEHVERGRVERGSAKLLAVGLAGLDDRHRHALAPQCEAEGQSDGACAGDDYAFFGHSPLPSLAAGNRFNPPFPPFNC